LGKRRIFASSGKGSIFSIDEPGDSNAEFVEDLQGQRQQYHRGQILWGENCRKHEINDDPPRSEGIQLAPVHQTETDQGKQDHRQLKGDADTEHETQNETGVVFDEPDRGRDPEPCENCTEA